MKHSYRLVARKCGFAGGTGGLKATTGIEPVQRSPRKSRKTPANRGRSVRPAATLPHQERAR
jgi:hypothetical protein